MKCKNCGEEFDQMTTTQKYCCEKCGYQYRKTHNVNEEYPKIIFNCSCCGKQVETEGGTKDRRTRFCSHTCEKKFWRHPHWESEHTRINFRSIEEYFQYEQKTNE